MANKGEPFDPSEFYVHDETCENLLCQPNQYPEYLEKPRPMSYAGTESGSFQSIFDLIIASLKCTDRVLLMTPWGNYAIIRGLQTPKEPNPKEKTPVKPEVEEKTYFLYDGCTCNANSFRYLDLRAGTAGFISFWCVRTMVCYIMDSRYKREKLSAISKSNLDVLCAPKQPTTTAENVEETIQGQKKPK